MYVYVRLCSCLRECLYLCVCACACAYACVLVRVRMPVRLCVCVCLCTCEWALACAGEVSRSLLNDPQTSSSWDSGPKWSTCACVCVVPLSQTSCLDIDYRNKRENNLKNTKLFLMWTGLGGINNPILDKQNRWRRAWMYRMEDTLPYNSYNLSGKILRRGKSFVGENPSPEKILRRRKSFAGENPSPGKILRRGKSFAGENPSPGKILRRGKSFAGENPSPGKILRRGKSFAGGKSSSPNQNVVTFPQRIFPR